MAKKKKSDRPKHVSIYYDQLLYDLDFMPNENAGIILKLIVWYAVGTPESKSKIDEMLEHIKTLPDCGWLTSLYHRLCSAIDEDLQAYADVCEKRRQAVAKREEYKKEREMSLGINKEQMISNDNNSNHKISNTDTEYDTDTVTDTDSSKEEEIYNNFFFIKKNGFPSLEDGWIRETIELIYREHKTMLQPEEVQKHYEDFKIREAAKIPDDYKVTLIEWRSHFANYIKTRIKANETSTSNLSSSERRQKESEERKSDVARRIAERIAFGKSH